MKLRKKRKLVSILLTLSFLVCMLVPMAGPAVASSTYSALSAPNVLNNDEEQALGTIQIDVPQTTGAGAPGKDSILLITLPTDFEINYGTPPVVTCTRSSGGAGSTFQGTINAIEEVSAREFKISYTVLTGDEDYDVRFLVTLPLVGIPSSADGDIKANLTSLGGDFSSGSVIVGVAGSGSVATYVNDTVTFTNSGTENGAVEIYLKENTRYALKDSAAPTAKFKLPKGLTWSAAADVINITTGDDPAVEVTAARGADPRVLEVDRSALTDVKSLYKISADIIVDDSEAVLGEVNVAVSGASSISPSTLLIGEYIDYGVNVVAVDDPTEVIPGRLNQEVADFNIEESAKGSLMNSRSVTLELPEGVKWAVLNDPTGTGSVDITAAGVTKVGTSGRKAKFTVDNPGTAKGKLKFENVEVDIAVDFSGDIKVKVDGAGIDNQEIVIAKAPVALTATATTPEVKIGMQNQAGGTVKIVEGAAETLINGKDLTVTAPDGVKWYTVPTVAVTEGDLSIDVDGVTKSGQVLTIPIKSQSTKAATIEISDVKYTVDRTVPEGYINLDIGGTAIDEVNDEAENAGALNYNFSNADEIWYMINADGFAFPGRTVAASVDAAKTITPAPGEEKSTAVFTIGSTTFTLNGVEQTMDAAPYIKNDRTYLPLRFVAKAVGVADTNIMWNAAEQSVVLIKGDRVVKLVIGSTTMLINGIPMTMDVAPEVVDPGRTMLPVRWVAQALGADIAWDAATQTVTVN